MKKIEIESFEDKTKDIERWKGVLDENDLSKYKGDPYFSDNFKIINNKKSNQK
jgi:hypothetical protein